MTSIRTTNRLRRALVTVLLGLFFLSITCGLHYYRGDAVKQFSDFNDESSHFLTGVLIRDYALHGLPGNPLRFAKDFYLHYPKIAFGSWPPLFHMVLGAWMLVLPATRFSAILLVNVTTAVFGVTAAIVARRLFAAPVAAAVGLAAMLAPITQQWDGIIQADTLYAVFSVACAYCFAAWLADGNRGSLCFFSLTFLAALATKNNALFLGITLPAMVLLTRKFGILRRKDIWLALLPGVVFCGVWQYFTLPFVRNNLLHDTTLAESVVGYLDQTVHLAWIGFLPFILWSVGKRIAMPVLRGQAVAAWDAASIGVVAGAYLFHAALPHSVNGRYLLPALVALLLFTAQALEDLFAMAAWRQLPGGARTVAIAVLLVAPEALGAFSVAPELPYGYAGLAQQIEEQCPAARCPSILISASFGAEGMMVAELAVRERRPGHYLIRATKILQERAGANNHQRELVHGDPRQMEQYFEELPIRLVVISDDGDTEPAATHDALNSIIQQNRAAWDKIMTVPVGGRCSGASCMVDVYQLKNAAARADFSPQKLPAGTGLWTQK